METTLYFGGPIVTLEEPLYVQALVERGGRIVYVGERGEAEALAGPAARRVDLEGRALLPAFVDAHSHLLACAYARLQVPLGECTSQREILERLSQQVQKQAVSAGEWVKGTGYDQNMLVEGAAPDRWMLDKACPDHPVVIQHASGHAGVFNTQALQRLGVLEGSCDLERDSQGRLTGRGEETPFLTLLQKVPLDSLEDVLGAFQAAQEEYASYGITVAQEGLLNKRMAPAYAEILRRGLLKLDVKAYVPPEEFADLRRQFRQGVSSSTGTFCLAGMKIFLDGSPQGRTAWVQEPYVGGGCGTPAMTDGQVLGAFQSALEYDVQILAHCNGDAAAEQYLTQLDRVERSEGRKLRRPVMIHAQLLRRDQLERVKALGVIPSFFEAHVYHWGETHVKNLGLERAERISPAGSAHRLGIPFTLHQDAPVIPPNMLETVWCACTRTTGAGRVLGEEERVPVRSALESVTQNAAYQYGLERERGTLRAGKWADFVLLSGDPLAVEREDIKRLQTEATVKAGRTIWSR